MSRSDSCHALLVHPRFEPNTFWNYQATCEVTGARYSAAPLGLITVAALLPEEWDVRLVNRNTEELSNADLDWADVVLTGGMLSQQRDALALVARAHARGKPVLVGGPDATCSPEVYGAAEFRVLGEAEEILSEFVAAWRDGADRGTWTAPRFPDLSRSPVPRFDLLKLNQYMHVGVQFSRGCPFNCEFCNVVELNGHAPRSKSAPQMLAELEALRALGYRGHVDFVDDNFIGDRKRVKPFLGELTRWCAEHGRPFEFTTEASLDLAGDPALLAGLRAAGFFAIFVGIETPDKEALAHAGKKQNLRRDIAESVTAIQKAGIFVNAGFIIGFDTERASVADPMVACIEESGIPVCMVGLLYALPATRLSRRLAAEGRLEDGSHLSLEGDVDQCTSGLNFRASRPKQEALQDYRDVLTRIYSPEAYFGRVRRTGRILDRSGPGVRLPPRLLWRDLKSFGRICWRLGVQDREARGAWWRAFIDCALHNPSALKIVASFGALYLHYGPFSRWLVERLDERIAGLRSQA